MLNIEIFNYDIVSNSVFCSSAELDIEKSMSIVASDNSFIAVNVYSSGRAHISCAVHIKLSHRNVLCYYNSIWGIGSSVFLQFVESRRFNDLSEKPSDVACLDLTGVIIRTVAGKSLKSVCIEKP